MTLNNLRERIGAVNDVLCALSLLIWDSRTMMPSGGTSTRGAQIATMTQLARELLLSAETRRALDGAESEVADRHVDDPGRREASRPLAPLRFMTGFRPIFFNAGRRARHRQCRLDRGAGAERFPALSAAPRKNGRPRARLRRCGRLGGSPL